jgi:hypothetical protein
MQGTARERERRCRARTQERPAVRATGTPLVGPTGTTRARPGTRVHLQHKPRGHCAGPHGPPQCPVGTTKSHDFQALGRTLPRARKFRRKEQRWSTPSGRGPAPARRQMCPAVCILSDFPMYFYFGTKTTSFGSPALKMRAPPPHIVRENTRNGDCLACETHRPWHVLGARGPQCVYFQKRTHVFVPFP